LKKRIREREWFRRLRISGRIEVRALKSALAALLVLATFCPVQPQSVPQPQLFSQAAQAILDRKFPSSDISYLLLDASGNVIAERWPADKQAISPGSLVKPFLAVAYGQQHGGRFPTVRCLGTKTHCWLPAGHGTLGLEEAIVQSCNTYFLALASGLDRASLDHGRAAQSFAHYGLRGPAAGATDESLIGLGTEWKESPLSLARAYLTLVSEQQSPTQGLLMKGMLGSASRGTARGVDAALGANAAFAKTGTADCSHTPPGPADGFTVAVYPAAQPRLLLLVRVHGITGAEAAKLAGAMLASLGAGSQ
jgi:cell division protein FtsI/penicillin-binding protein 2